MRAVRIYIVFFACSSLTIRFAGGFGSQYGGVFAVPAVGEKGYIDTRVEVTSPGGHSSIPPLHTVSYFILLVQSYSISES